MLRSPNAEFISKQQVRVKLTGDGTSIGKHLHVVNFGFMLLDEHTVLQEITALQFVFKETGNYDSLKTAVQDIVAEIESLKIIRVNGIDFEITYYLGGD